MFHKLRRKKIIYFIIYMSSTSAPSYYFSGINFNSSFFSSSSSSNNLSSVYLKKTTADSATGLITFNAGISTASIQSSTSTTINAYTTSNSTSNLNMGNANLTMNLNSPVITQNSLSCYSGINANSLVNNSSSSASVFSTNSYATIVGGTGGVFLSTSGNRYVDISTQSITNKAFINFHSSNNSNGYDTQIVSTGGTSSNGNGTLDINAGTLNINTYQFRFVPWTTVATVSTNLATVLNFPIGGNLPVAGNTVTLKYRYSVIGNSMYINYLYTHASLGSASSGTGFYQYLIPSSYTLNTTDVVVSGTINYPAGTKVGTCLLVTNSVSSSYVGTVHIGNLNGYGFLLWATTGVNSENCQNSGFNGFAQAGLTVQFEAIIPIN